MAFSTAAKQKVALLLFNATAWTGVAVNDTGTPITIISFALHTADPSTGNQSTSEATYTSYARASCARTISGLSSTAGVVTNVAAINFPACTGGTNTISNVSVGEVITGATEIIVAGALTSSLAVSSGITPSFAISGLSITVA